MTTWLFDFSRPDTEAQWQAVDDRIMGGRSQSGVRRLDKAVVAFAGHMTREGGGGFASVHAALAAPLPAACDRLQLRCRGDGRSYSLRLRQQGAYDGISYRCDFRPTEDDWQDVELRLADFRATFRGRDLPNTDALQPGKVLSMGLLVAGAQTGDFSLEMKYIVALEPGDVKQE